MKKIVCLYLTSPNAHVQQSYQIHCVLGKDSTPSRKLIFIILLFSVGKLVSRTERKVSRERMYVQI